MEHGTSTTSFTRLAIVPAALRNTIFVPSTQTRLADIIVILLCGHYIEFDFDFTGLTCTNTLIDFVGHVRVVLLQIQHELNHLNLSTIFQLKPRSKFFMLTDTQHSAGKFTGFKDSEIYVIACFLDKDSKFLGICGEALDLL
ncbi:hypothetical protein ACHAWU_010425 [Discostella pseudostelligera]|uniref:Uncharacterized protein n=1 Tax=Discostella pseudostelligera TaxID=259834 RepID=A0ABD3M975_9STRA